MNRIVVASLTFLLLVQAVVAQDAPPRKGKRANQEPLAPAELPTVRGDRAAFTITDRVVVKDSPVAGINFEPTTPRPWRQEPQFNCWNTMGSPEPVDVRAKIRATGGGPDFIEAKFLKGTSAGLSYYKLYKDGFWDGADIYVYRYENNACRLVRKAKIKSSLCGDETSPNRAEFTDSGEAPKEGDEFVIAQRRDNITGQDYRPFEQKNEAISWLEPGKNSTEIPREIDSKTAAPDGGSTASLKIMWPAGDGQLQQPFLGIGAGWMRLTQGHPYLLSVWLKSEGMADGKVTVSAGSLGTATFQPGPDWKKFTFEFTGGPVTKPEAISVAAKGPGTLWLDNLLVSEKCDVPPFGIYPNQVENFRKFHPSVIRIWTLQVNAGAGVSLEAGINPPFAAPMGLETRRVEKLQTVNLHALLDLCEKAQADPWIITNTMFSPEEQQGLIEYLAGPADSPWGAKRAAAGRQEPWTKAFRKIYIELGNETWNSTFATQGFVGRGDQYGAYAQLVFDTMTKAPHFSKDTFRFIVNGWSSRADADGYGQKAAAACPLADYVDFAPYLGGWDVGGIADQGSDPVAVFSRLVINDRMHAATLATAKETADELSKGRAKPLANAIYEAGPGYSIPGAGKPVDPVEQANGKSLAIAIAYFDQFLSDRELGYGPQNFFTYGSGNYWKTHNEKGQPHITTLGLGLLNEQTRGDLLAVEATAQPIADLGAISLQKEVQDRKTKEKSTKTKKVAGVKDVPLVKCFAFRNPKALTVVLLSKRIDAATPVQLKLPAGISQGKGFLLTSANAMDNNIEDEKVTVKETALPAVTPSFEYKLPPYSMAVLVFPTK